MNTKLLLAGLLWVLLFSPAPGADWSAGAARQKITPPEPIWMSGYASRTKPAEGTLHDLWAKAVVIQAPDGERVVLISLDLVGVGRDISVDVCEALKKAHGLRRSQIALCTSHTHTGPVVGRNLGTMYFLDPVNQKKVLDYTVFLQKSILSVVSSAISAMEPATISYGIGSAGFAVNRRNNREADVPQLREDGKLQGPVDHSAPVIAVRDRSGALKSVVFGYACHATVLSFYEWSGDWPGFAQLAIERRHPDTIALFMAGCGADQNPLPRRTVELAAGYGKQMADAVDRVLAAPMKRVEKTVRSHYVEIPLALAALPSRETMEKDKASTNKYIAARADVLLGKLERDGKLDETYPYPVQVWDVGELSLVILGGEVVIDYSLRLRQEFADRDLWVAGYSNDVMAYIPSLRVLKEGGYEGATSMIYYGLPTVWSEAVEEDIVTTVRKLLGGEPAE